MICEFDVKLGNWIICVLKPTIPRRTTTTTPKTISLVVQPRILFHFLLCMLEPVPVFRGWPIVLTFCCLFAILPHLLASKLLCTCERNVKQRERTWSSIRFALLQWMSTSSNMKAEYQPLPQLRGSESIFSWYSVTFCYCSFHKEKEFQNGNEKTVWCFRLA